MWQCAGVLEVSLKILHLRTHKELLLTRTPHQPNHRRETSGSCSGRRVKPEVQYYVERERRMNYQWRALPTWFPQRVFGLTKAEEIKTCT